MFYIQPMKALRVRCLCILRNVLSRVCICVCASKATDTGAVAIFNHCSCSGGRADSQDGPYQLPTGSSTNYRWRHPVWVMQGWESWVLDNTWYHSLVDRVWLMVHGSWLKAHASRLAALARLTPRKICRWVSQRQFFLGHEPGALSHEPWAMRHEPWNIDTMSNNKSTARRIT